MDATTETPTRRYGWERHHFALRRLHSLTGVVPVGLFLIEQLATNYSSLTGEAPWCFSGHFSAGDSAKSWVICP